MPAESEREYQREYQYTPKRAAYKRRYMAEYAQRPEVIERRRERSRLRYALKKGQQASTDAEHEAD